MAYKVNMESPGGDAKDVRWICTCGKKGAYTTIGRATAAGAAHLAAHRAKGE